VAQFGANAFGEALEPAECRTATSASASIHQPVERPRSWWLRQPCCVLLCRSRTAPCCLSFETGSADRPVRRSAAPRWPVGPSDLP
jgi:hypothetical protein